MARFGVKEVADMIFYNLVTGEPELFLDSLKMSNLENNAETSYATGGKGAPRLVGWDFNRTATFTIQDALLNPKAIAMQTGVEAETKIERIHKRELTVAVDGGTGNAKVSLGEVPVGNVILYTTADGYGHDAKVTGTTVTGQDVEAPVASLPIGEKVIAYYEYETTADAEVITIKSDKFAGMYKAVGDTLWRNEKTGEDEKVQIVISKAKLSSAFTLTMQPDGEPSVFDFNLDVFKADGTTEMVKIIRY